MKFTKMHGCGNDYVYVDCTKEVIPNISETAIRVSDRHFGIGSDGLILIKASDVADFEMDMYNADGSRGKMCGNGIRCVAKYVYDHGLTDKTTITVNTLSGIKTLKLTVEDGKVSKVRVDMGEPELIPAQVPVKASVLGLADDRREAIVAEPLEIKGRSYDITCVSMGNPHCITFIGEDVRDFPLEEVGPVFEKHELFPERVNTEFINVIDKDHLRMRVWERGSGETLACGTGACAVAVASYLNGFTGRSVDIELLGGHLEVVYDEKTNHVFMTGPATEVFSGEIDL
ncbi:diaminopimelate epimerase [Roseburia sp. AM51-8]|uniref:Diaminopimelate epimerase n=1 Tax=Roseburia lenta TaxID=2763061 RepID=A0ABR7GDX8_9FIRM|nr:MULTISPECIES: diaminopimelate epimerase [Roseburia]MBC5685648.1 diaminopimelate epimerase [Roseburia lenta]RHQ02137.1 diaminopimelate epimerase [Roseburia sp. AM51-8]